MDTTHKGLMELSDADLLEAYCRSTERVQYSALDYWQEAVRRSQERQARALKWWTAVIALAAVANVGVVIYQAWKVP